MMKRASAGLTLLLCTFGVVIVSIGAMLTRLNAVNAAATTLDPVLGTISATAVVGSLFVLSGIVCLGLAAYRFINMTRM